MINEARNNAEQPGMDCAPDTQTHEPSRKSRWPAAGLIALLAFTLSVRLIDPTGWLGSDDSGYFAAAEHILQGETIQRVHHHYARMAMIVPVAASIAVFGPTATAVWFPTLLASLMCIMAVAWTGRMLWGWREGLLAALIVSVVPYFRILSTAGFPDVHVCMWTAISLALAVCALRCKTVRSIQWLVLASGFCVAMATLTKILTAPLVGAILLFILQDTTRSRSAKFRLALVFCIGGVIGIIAEGLFFQWFAGDFLFNYHAHALALVGVPTLDLTGASANSSTWNLAIDRLTMMFHPNSSGWGTIGIGFWIACIAGLWYRSTRWLAVWLVGAYLLLAVCPIGFKNGAIKLNPVFHGRHILPLCIPFALCVAYGIGRTANTRLAVMARVAFPIAILGVVGLAVSDRHQLNGFVNRTTSRLGVAISQIAQDPALADGDASIFMTPSTYWRYRILFPERLRARLAVSADPSAPDWWKQTTTDITSRFAPLPSPQDAYLIATPTQLRGIPEQWDYGISLPAQRLKPWQAASPRTIIARLPNRTIQAVAADRAVKNRLLVLLGGLQERQELADGRP
jgi:4-amino-4-deoxy-L-arabinose transferase-like glycosyltransferase